MLSSRIHGQVPENYDMDSQEKILADLPQSSGDPIRPKESDLGTSSNPNQNGWLLWVSFSQPNGGRSTSLRNSSSCICQVRPLHGPRDFQDRAEFAHFRCRLGSKRPRRLTCCGRDKKRTKPGNQKVRWRAWEKLS